MELVSYLGTKYQLVLKCYLWKHNYPFFTKAITFKEGFKLACTENSYLITVECTYM